MCKNCDSFTTKIWSKFYTFLKGTKKAGSTSSRCFDSRSYPSMHARLHWHSNNSAIRWKDLRTCSSKASSEYLSASSFQRFSARELLFLSFGSISSMGKFSSCQTIRLTWLSHFSILVFSPAFCRSISRWMSRWLLCKSVVNLSQISWIQFFSFLIWFLLRIQFFRSRVNSWRVRILKAGARHSTSISRSTSTCSCSSKIKPPIYKSKLSSLLLRN